MDLLAPIAAAQAARSRLDWRAAAMAFTAAADALPADPHGNVTAEERSLRRNAHLCLCRTPQFQAYRERMHSQKPRPDLSHEWLNPRGSLVDMLLAPRSRSAA
ncbi:hypothetical protein [Variovorax sp. UMC13]|uniref:hypothetical protein n=1 Tax=Variovorax sp. UMC13 TaxID=1862326 RepID=UPI00160210FD|nr:hypothetical protein [Variovorax sp. UMC13]MBB1599946.1 hypothetical protein [Variovorax sp. UMC13]